MIKFLKSPVNIILTLLGLAAVYYSIPAAKLMVELYYWFEIDVFLNHELDIISATAFIVVFIIGLIWGK